MQMLHLPMASKRKQKALPIAMALRPTGRLAEKALIELLASRRAGCCGSLRALGAASAGGKRERELYPARGLSSD